MGSHPAPCGPRTRCCAARSPTPSAQGLLTRNVADLADPPSAAAAKAEARKAVKTWTPAQLRQFLDHTRDHRLYPAFLLGAMTGMRRGEVLGLRWQDLDLDNRSLSVTQTLVAPRYELVFSEPKTDGGTPPGVAR